MDVQPDPPAGRGRWARWLWPLAAVLAGHGHRGAHQEEVRQLDEIRDPGELARGLDLELLGERRFGNRIGRNVADHQRVTVGHRVRCQLERDGAYLGKVE